MPCIDTLDHKINLMDQVNDNLTSVLTYNIKNTYINNVVQVVTVLSFHCSHLTYFYNFGPSTSDNECYSLMSV